MTCDKNESSVVGASIIIQSMATPPFMSFWWPPTIFVLHIATLTLEELKLLQELHWDKLVSRKKKGCYIQMDVMMRIMFVCLTDIQQSQITYVKSWYGL